jgi:transcriptional regulator with XRE-family HTH domain
MGHRGTGSYLACGDTGVPGGEAAPDAQNAALCRVKEDGSGEQGRGPWAAQGKARGMNQHELDHRTDLHIDHHANHHVTHRTPSARLALGLALRAMHQRSNRTLRAMERDISISDSTLSRYFRGKAVPSWPTTEKICAAFGEDPASVRELWVAAIAERSNAEFPVVNGTAGGGSGAALAVSDDGDRDSSSGSNSENDCDSDGDDARADGGTDVVARPRWRIWPRSRSSWLGTGLVVGFALGVLLTALFARGAASAPPSRSCPWKYVVTDGVPDDMRVFDDPQRDNIIARYVPDEVFYAPEPPQIVNGLMQTEDGWVGVGDWVQRYAGDGCHVDGH